MKPKIYLAGSLTDDTWKGMKFELKQSFAEVDFIDPADKKLKDDEAIKWDLDAIRKCDAVIAYTLAPTTGTYMELVYARHRVFIDFIWVIAFGHKDIWINRHSDKVFTDFKEMKRELKKKLKGMK